VAAAATTASPGVPLERMAGVRQLLSLLLLPPPPFLLELLGDPLQAETRKLRPLV